ncbi:MAG TPA: 1-(5-phosphoribosyl)-5-[(5-phosphoribosylamino)methylideneamino]imidazole-4-carboxamide isomerase [Acidimicrobiales bacterium]|jgi:phosphoribosylformimino-5-aminoimidazole carboxamide ribotide isomerase|nr:1-(5-phosphoribosyl)-5-[(5-phosphoribosylamino)methylideneamino]imidazole-4-carboxamide isomerase [Actinomycetes bacterium]MDP6104703.1 1-(5-phosphoribosyl)-5-[(5-phosphoribosylamino)methylideneamino]imidazole-4-carboxamide isomerase [Acidimicrobiales bacterium]MDP6241204.1 1-(5-phosphoribosyl)-5-[(5-phosphoribosylamino)methylideneamino]imidazole-4-carboxamide isomerase [Acidimicrobiales bacterium]MDP7124651.1 1-(5-phosphoribosyl)-5-[(5-phosphoribosylamino)methylideneamino]imidazole-4-carboxa|tara:strand:+ start:18857 stop:19606 length:750 start_codon:yes stop_codon:yes gene_type:complete
MSAVALFPAIDLRDGHCVRLLRGDYGQETVYGDDPVSQALAFQAAGAPWVHVVDLDAARSGDPVNRPFVAAIAAALDIPVQAGGGIRSIDAAAELFAAGVRRVVLGTAAVERPGLVGEVASLGAVAVGLDVRGRELAVHGWTESSGLLLGPALRQFEGLGAEALVVTQIEQDGTLEGPDIGMYREALEATRLDVVASGGVGTPGHLDDLAALDVDGRRLAGVIVGRALYEGNVDVADAIGRLTGRGGTP